MAHGLHRAAQPARDRARAAPIRTQEHDLGASHSEGARRSQGRFELGALLSARLADENGRMHLNPMRALSTSHNSSAEDALVLRQP
jgi:hypothetical protein